MNYERAVSDLVSFPIVFTTIVFLIGTITITVITTLNDVRAGTESNVAEATMRGYAETLSDHRTMSAPARSTTIKVQGHNFRRVSSTMGVAVLNSTGTRIQMDSGTGALVRTTNTDTRLVYESGGVFRLGEDGGAIVVRPPPVRCADGASAHLPLTLVRGDVNISADNRVTMESRLLEQDLRYPNNTSQNASADTVTIDTSELYATAGWNRTLDDWDNPSPNVYECDVERVVVHETTIEIDPVT